MKEDIAFSEFKHANKIVSAKDVNEFKLCMQNLEIAGKVWQFEDLWSFTKDEHEQLVAFQALVDGYVSLAAPPRPLCLAVFGPPGSGKSYVVKKICETLVEKHKAKDLRLPFTETNLTELRNTSDLIRHIRGVKLTADPRTIPVIFFDEFDAPLGGISYGWLSRLLAPMQDGTLFDAGERFEVKRAVYIFAGGTAHRMADFANSSDSHFREAKGPDFVSRLRGYIDVKGPNDPEGTLLRRAILIRATLSSVTRAATGKTADPPRQISEELLRAMLTVGRYKHGSRSITAILEMAAAAAKIDESLDFRHLPADHLLAVHRDRGQLDANSIGGLIGVSAGTVHSIPDKSAKSSAIDLAGNDSNARREWETVALAITDELWKIGAVVGYGGK